jgi:hypothetical protein
MASTSYEKRLPLPATIATELTPLSSATINDRRANADPATWRTGLNRPLIGYA